MSRFFEALLRAERERVASVDNEPATATAVPDSFATIAPASYSSNEEEGDLSVEALSDCWPQPESSLFPAVFQMGTDLSAIQPERRLRPRPSMERPLFSYEF
jgi:hypothetical protein